MQGFACVQDGEEEEEKAAAPRAPKDEDVFAGNKNLRSEDNKFRERDMDRCDAPSACSTLVFSA